MRQSLIVYGFLIRYMWIEFLVQKEQIAIPEIVLLELYGSYLVVLCVNFITNANINFPLCYFFVYFFIIYYNFYYQTRHTIILIFGNSSQNPKFLLLGTTVHYLKNSNGAN